MRSISRLLGVSIIAGCLAAPAFSSTKGAAEAVATVNGETISQPEFDKDWEAFVAQEKRMMRPEQMTSQWEQAGKRMLLQKMVERRLILQEAKKRGVPVEKR